jgi:acyl carrier protein
MGRVLSQGATQVAVVPVDWDKYRQFYPGGTESALLSELGGEQTASSPPSIHAGEKRTALLAAEPGERFQLVQSYVTELVARVLGQDASKVDIQQPLSNLGLDSLMAVELKNRIATDLGVNVPMVTFLSGPSVEQAATQLLHLLTAEAPAASVPVASYDIVDQAPPQDVDQYSDEEVDSMLTDLLAKEGARE